MKFRITLKDPDGVYDSLDDAAKKSARDVACIDDGERKLIEEARRNAMSQFIGRWLSYGEYATIEFDTDAGTATLVKDDS